MEKFSPEEKAKMQESHTLSDAELIKEGAHYIPTEQGEPRLEITAEQIEKIKRESPEEFRAGIEAFEAKVDEFIKAFPEPEKTAPRDENVCKLLYLIYLTDPSDYRNIGACAERMGFPVEKTEHPRFGTSYKIPVVVEETVRKIIENAHQKLAELALEVADKQAEKQKQESRKKFAEIDRYLQAKRGFGISESLESYAEAQGYLRREYWWKGPKSTQEEEQMDENRKREVKKLDEYLEILNNFFRAEKYLKSRNIEDAVKILGSTGIPFDF